MIHETPQETRLGQHVLLLILLLFAHFIWSPAFAEPVLFVQDNAYPPYMSNDNDLPTGLYAEILKEARTRMGTEDLQILAVPWTRAIIMVENGSAQGLVGTYYKPQDRPWIRHWSEPIYYEEVSIFCRDGIAKENWIYPDDYTGLLFGNVAGYKAPGARFFELVEQGKIKLEEAQTTEQNLSKLTLARIDCFVVERIATEILMREKNITNVKTVGTASMEAAYIGYSDKWTGPKADAFIKAMDITLAQMKKDGTIDKIVARFSGS